MSVVAATTGKKKRIVIAEDHTILREGLKSLLSASPDLAIVGEAADGREAIRRCLELKPDLLLLDLSMPRLNGIEAIGEVKRRVPATKILVLTVHKTEEYVLASLRAGAAGYVLKDATHQELLAAIRTVLAGKRYLSPDIAAHVIDGYLLGRKHEAPVTPWERLTPREREVLKLVAEGGRNREIADFLCISLKTVEKHRDSLMKKLDLHSAAALTAYAIARGLVDDQQHELKTREQGGNADEKN
ncbi:MAG TPA: response regulator transcription factor [Syntrophales bacterium]|nr:response regulator transcription factor [Syntrophales bacterium]HON23721.1 response regulator transcription factor [Syntrophales bacterium]HOU77606.1 response regulator transcription factor [Syntrophales bacterium]HPC32381.1 response regulator transcription factor [Syntrophales bacterium]HQG34630.1 response regulator transcription factor [Syntrophales bacterium]